MIYSMTGFAAKTITIVGENNEKTNVSISVKSLNSRFFDTTFKLHYSLALIEHQIVALAKKLLHRGHIFCIIHVSNPNAFRGSVQPALPTVASYLHALEVIQQQCHTTDQVSLTHILQFPNIFSVEEVELHESTIQTILDSIRELLNNLCAMRLQEGKDLQKDLENRLMIMQQEIDAIAQQSSSVMERQKTKIKDALKEFDLDDKLGVNTQKNNLYATLDKIDINEEIVRFKSHVTSLIKQLTSSTVEKGKRIDFTLQEMVREINTIASKCSDSLISEHAINIKVEIEKAREQAQNIV